MLQAIIPITVFVIVIVVHEVAHGAVAFYLGDNTAKEAGRLTLNPIAHIDPVGTVILPALLVATHSPVVFGWAKPVPINPANFKNPRKGMFLTSIAGPGANFVLALIFSLLFKIGIFPKGSIPWQFLFYGVLISLILGIFNMMPIPPLDGAGVLFSLLPGRLAVRFSWLEQYGFLILIAMLYLGLFNRVILPLTVFIMKIMIG